MTGAEYMRARRARLSAEGRCIDCTGAMLPEWIGTICPTCRERRAASHARYARRHRAARRALSRKLYRDHRDERLASQRARRLERKLAGLCVWCGTPASDESVYCETHRERTNSVRRKHACPVVTQRSNP